MPNFQRASSRRRSAAPVADVEGRIGQDVVGREVFVQVAMKTVDGLDSVISLDAANGEVHSPQRGRGGIPRLSEGSDVRFPLSESVAGHIFLVPRPFLQS